MTAITFPNSPSSGDTHTAGNGIVYTYDGEKWTSIGTNSAGTWTRSGTEVSLTNAGDDLNVDSGTLFVDASTDRVGVGTSTVDQLLHLRASAPKLKIEGTGTTDEIGIHFAANANNWFIRSDNSTGQNTFSIKSGTPASSTHRLLIDASGNVGIGTTAPGAALDVKGNYFILNSTSANSNNIIFKVSDVTKGYIGPAGNLGGSDNDMGYRAESGNNQVFYIGASERLRIDSSGRLLVGTSSARTNFHNNSSYTTRSQIEGTDFQTSALSLVCNNTVDYESTSITLAKSGGSVIGSNTLVANGESLGIIRFEGNDGSEFIEAARISSEIDGTPGSNDMPGRLVFSTTADGASSPTERMRIASDGKVTVNGGVLELSGQSYLDGQEGYIDFRSTTYGVAIRSALRNILIYTTNTAGVVLNNGATSFSPFTSESRLKNIIGDVDSDQAWDLVRDIELKRYQYKDGEDQLVPYAGPMADWLGQQDPELLIDTGKSDDDGPIHTYNQGLLDMKALAALSAALKRIETLEAKVATLEAS